MMHSLLLLSVAFLAMVIYLVIDYRGPRKIKVRRGTSFNFEYGRAGELVVQEFDGEGNLWASRGLLVYRMNMGTTVFERVAHVPTGFSYLWLNNFTLFRKFTNKPECLEFTIGRHGSICALSAGYMWFSPLNRIRFKRSLKLRHYGFGVGRGILSNGLLSASDGRIYFGEYFRNPERKEVHLYRSSDGGKSWEVAHTYAPGDIRHIHGIQEDPFTGRLWTCAGDSDSESKIGWSDDRFKTITHIGTGSQAWRTTQLVFTAEAVYWGADTGSVGLGGIYRWDRNTGELARVCSTGGGILFGTSLLNGTLVFSTDREGFENEEDHKTRLLMVGVQGHVKEIEFGTWRHWKKSLRYSFAMLRIPRKQGSSFLALTVINQKEFPAGEVIFVEESTLDNFRGPGQDYGE